MPDYVVTLTYTDHEGLLRKQCFGTMDEISIRKRYRKGVVDAVRLLDINDTYGFTVGDPAVGDSISIKRVK